MLFQNRVFFLVCIVPFVVDSFPDPYGYWPLTEGWGMRDRSGNGFHGRYANASGEPSFTQCEICSFKYCETSRVSSYNAGFKGEDDYVVIDHPEFNFNYTSWTFACFFNSRGTMGPILEYPTDIAFYGGHFWSNYPTSDTIFFNPMNGEQSHHFPCPMQDWQFVAISYNMNSQRYSFFCNDSFVGEGNGTQSVFHPRLNLAKR